MTPNTIQIDTMPYAAAHKRLPRDSHLATWTFVIDREEVRIYGSYAEACALARLEARLRDAQSGVVLLERTAAGRVHTGELPGSTFPSRYTRARSSR